MSGQVDAAIVEFRGVLDDCLRVLGADHPDTLATRASLARWLGESGQVDAAIVEYRQLLEDRLRVLGANHPDTLTTRASLAYWLSESR